MFYGFEDFLNYTLYFPELEVEDGFAMIGGTPLPAAIREAATDSELTLFKVLKKVSLEIFDALYILHSHGWFHGDIRPYNIVLDENGDAKLIDFVTADVFGDKKRFYFSQGHFDNFFSTQLIQSPYLFTAMGIRTTCLFHTFLCFEPFIHQRCLWLN